MRPWATVQEWLALGDRLCTKGVDVFNGSEVMESEAGTRDPKVVSAVEGKEVASIPIGKGPDAVIYDDQRQLAFIPCGRDGVLEVISTADPAKVALVQTQMLARTGASIRSPAAST